MMQSNPADARQWTPRVADGPAPYYLRLVDALQQAIHAGELGAGSRLPTQRALAAALRISVGTASAALEEAERRGLVRRHVGRGSFVASSGTRAWASPGGLNLAINVPPVHRIAPLVRSLLAQLIEDVDTVDLLGYPPFADSGRYVAAVAGWLSRMHAMGVVTPQEVLPCQGATQGLLAVLDCVATRGDTVITEQVTYGGFKVAAQQHGLRLVAAAIDDEGMRPEALEDAARRSGARVAMLTPTLHNPTGATAGPARRRALAAVAERLDLVLIEDDVYGGLVRTPLPPIATLVPQRTYLVGSASKSLAPGLRAGWVRPPAQARERVAAALQARTAALAPFGCPILTAGAAPFGFLAFAKLCETRMADELAMQIRDEAAARAAIARRVLGAHLPDEAAIAALHAWLPLDALGAETIHQRLAEQQIHVTPPGAPMVDAPPCGLRVCLGWPERHAQLEQALQVIADELARHAGGQAGWRP